MIGACSACSGLPTAGVWENAVVTGLSPRKPGGKGLLHGFRGGGQALVAGSASGIVFMLAHALFRRRVVAARRRCLMALAGILLAVPACAHGRAAARPLSAADAALLPPVTPACISSPFGPRILPHHPLAGTFHNGIDLPAPAGAPVRAIGPGTVIRAERRGPGGLQLLVQHDGFIGVYGHLGSIAPVIADGRRVVYGGETLGVVGHSGLTYGMHLFFGMIRDGHFVDPARYLNIARCGTGMRKRSDMVAGDGRSPPTRSDGSHLGRAAERQVSG